MRTPGVFISEWMLPLALSTLNFLPSCEYGRTGHETNVGNRAVRPDVAVHAGRGAQRRVGRLAHDHDLLAVVVDQLVAGGGPLDAGRVELAEPLERLQLRVVTVLRHHRHAQERQAQHVERHQRPIQGKHVGQRMRDRLHAAGGASAFPDHRIGNPARLDLGALQHAVQVLEHIAALFLLGDFE
jgi:hypothetical protein